MPNPLYKEFVKNTMPNNSIVQKFMQFKKSFSGNAQQQVQQLLDSGRISQQQYDNAVRMAQQLQNMLR